MFALQFRKLKQLTFIYLISADFVFLRLLLRKEGTIFRTTAEFESVRTLKEKACYLSNNPVKEESVETEQINYTLPDGSVIKVGPARFRAPEILFKPDLVGKKTF